MSKYQEPRFNIMPKKYMPSVEYRLEALKFITRMMRELSSNI